MGGVARPRQGELLVSEVFGPTLQGEGPSAGQPAAFVRLGGCNLSCRWCDTTYTWDGRRHDLGRELRVRSTEQVAREVLALGTSLIIITGGEPGIQAREATRLALAVSSSGARVEVETNGTLPLLGLSEVAALVVVSPKLESAGMRERSRLRWPVLSLLASMSQVVFKFVVGTARELDDVQEVVNRLSLTPDRVWVMPEATDREVLIQRMQDLALPVLARGWSLSGRLQVLLWENKRGR